MEKNISELIDLKKVDALLEGFNNASGFVTAILDLEGNILSKSGWRQICTEFHRIHPETSKRCTFSDTVLAGKMKKGEKYHAYTCRNGLTDVAVPIEINGRHVANLFSGQFFFEDSDIDFFKRQAKTYGFDENTYIKYLKEVPVVSEEKVKESMLFLLKMTEFISDQGLNNLEQAELNKSLKKNEEKLKSVNQQLEENNQQLQATELQLLAANKLLELKNQQLRNVFDNTRNVHYSHTTDHVITFISPQVEEVLGYTPEEAKINWTELASDNPINNIGYEKTVKAIETGERQSPYELELLRKDGVPVIVEVNESPLVKDGKTVAIIGSLADITERKQSEIKLKESENKYRTIFNSTGTVTMLVRSNTYIQMANNEAERVTGFTAEELTGSKWTDHVAQHSLEKMMHYHKTRRTNPEKVPSQYEVDLIHKSGDTRRSLLTIGMIPHSELSIVTLIDITERYNAIKKLKESEEKLNEAQEIARLGNLEWNLQTNETFWSSMLFQIHGLDQKESIPPYDKYLEHVHEEDRILIKESVSEAFKTGKYLCEYRIKKYDTGENCYLYTLGRIEYDSNNKPLLLKATEQDITERKQAEEKIKKQNQEYEALNEELIQTNDELVAAIQNEEESNDRFNKAMEATSDGLFDWNLITNEIYYSPRWKFMLGYEDDELPNDFSVWEQLTRPEDVKRSWEMLNALIEGKKEKFDVEFKMKHKAGHWLDINSRANVFRNKKGKAIRLVGTHTDITERKIAETKLRKSEETLKINYSRYRKAEEIGKVGNWEYIIATDEFWASDQSKLIYGFDLGQESFTVEQVESCIPDRKRVHQALIDLIETGKPYNLEFDIITNDTGKRKTITSLAELIKDEDGAPLRIVGVIQDITERKQAQEKLRKYNEYLESIFKSAPIGIGTVSNRLFQTVNDKLCAMVGYTKDELHGEEARILYPTEEDFQFVGKEKYKQIKKYGSGTVETRFKRKNGQIIDVLLSSAPIDINNPSENVTFSALDITEKNKANVKLIEAMEKAQESDRLKSAFLTNMSHEIRTPMNGILGFTDLLKEPQLSGDQKERYIQVIERSGKRMLDTINDIIDISKIESGQVKVEKSVVSVNSILDEQFSFFQREANSKGLELIYNIALAEQHSSILTDQHKLEGILINLIKNAIKYTPQGKIEMGCALKEKKDGKYVEFFVKDTGLGIPSGRIDSIFNRFEQADIEDKKAMEGSGLGLAITKSYVEMLGGEISVKSTEGKGSIFTFSIPNVTGNTVERTEKMPEKKDPQAPFKNVSAIIAEDDEDGQLFLETVLRGHFNKIICTSTGKETIEALKKNPSTDIILMDIKMPEMNGYDATREIRKFNQDVIIIAQTAYGLSGDEEKAIEAGCDDYIAKPITKDALFAKIEGCLDEKSKQI